MPVEAFTVSDAARLKIVISNTQRLINMMATPEFVGAETMREIENVNAGFAVITDALATPLKEWAASEKALAQPSWGISEPEIPLLPISARGAKFDNLAIEAATLSKKFLRIRNLSPAAISLIDETKMMIAVLKKSSSANDANPKLVKTHANYLKAVDRIFKRIDDGKIFPASVMAGLQSSVHTMLDQVEEAKGGLSYVETLFFPGGDIIKSRTQCTEQGPGRWLPKPTDVVATFFTLANPDLENGGGIKAQPFCGGNGCQSQILWLL